MTIGVQTTSSYVCGGYDSPDDDVIEQQEWEGEGRVRPAGVGHTLRMRRARGLRCIVVRGRCLTRQMITSGRHREPQKKSVPPLSGALLVLSTRKNGKLQLYGEN